MWNALAKGAVIFIMFILVLTTNRLGEIRALIKFGIEPYEITKWDLHDWIFNIFAALLMTCALCL